MIGTILCLALVASVGWMLGVYVAVWNTRPVTMWDEKVKHWRPHSLLGTPWRSKRHGPNPGKPLERRRPRVEHSHVMIRRPLGTLPLPPVPPLEQSSLEQPPTEALDTTV